MLEFTFDPLTLSSAVTPILKSLASDSSCASYVPLLQHAVLSRLFSQLSQVYSTIKISNLLELVVPLREVAAEGTYDDEQIEAYVMRCARRGELNVRVDHAASSITLADSPFATVEDPSSSTSAAALGAVQPSTSEFVRTRLGSIAVTLHKSLATIEPPTQPTEEEQRAEFAALVAVAEAERKALQIRRRALVARRRELLSDFSDTSANAMDIDTDQAKSDARALAHSLRTLVSIVSEHLSNEGRSVFHDFASFMRLALADTAEQVGDSAHNTAELREVDKDVAEGQRNEIGIKRKAEEEPEDADARAKFERGMDSAKEVGSKAIGAGQAAAQTTQDLANRTTSRLQDAYYKVRPLQSTQADFPLTVC